MSLINDALKKAQRQRSADSHPPQPSLATPEVSPNTAVKRAKPLALQSQGGRLAATVLSIGIILIGGVLFWQWESFAPEQLALGTPKSPAAAQPTVFQVSLPIMPLAAEAPLPNNTTLAAAATLVPAIAAPIAAPPVENRREPEAVVPVSKPRPNPKILAFIDTLRVTGIRAAGSDSKVLMNDRVFRVHDIVDHALGLRLTAAAANALTFEDENGIVYTRNF